MPIESNTRIGNYEVIRTLGSGGMGEVYLARDLRLDRNVALKFLPQQHQDDPLRVRRFLREAQAASALNHPNIVTIYDAGEAEMGHFIVMELVRGRTLRALIGQPPALDEFLKVCLQMVRGLAVAHVANIIHRDLKPENLMVRDDGYLKILDFGLAYRELGGEMPNDSMATTLSGDWILGSPRYMSPEQARGEKLTPASDIFSLGIVFYEFATAHHPFGSGGSLSVLNGILNQAVVPPSRLNPNLSRTLDLLVQRMLEKNPRLRPTCSEIESILAEPAGVDRNPAGVVSDTRPIVGRESEREKLNLALESAVTGQGGLVCVEGEAGLGKTTLVEHFLADASRKHKYWIARGRSSERLEGTEAYVPILEALESLIYGPEGASVARVMKLVAPTWYLQVTPSTPTGSTVSQVLSQALAGSQDRLRREFVSLLQETSRSHVVILFLDDLHWADVSTIDLLLSIATRLSELRVLIIVTYRTVEMRLAKHRFLQVQHDLRARGACQTIELGFLTTKDVHDYIDLQFPHHDFPLRFISLVHARTEGNALFMVEVLRYLKDQKLIAQVGRRWLLAESIPDIDRKLPESVRGMIQRSIDMLSPDQTRLLTAASVQGYEFHAIVVANVLDLDPADVEEQLDLLDRVHGFCRTLSEETFPDGSVTIRCRFVHVLYQSALYGSLKPARKASLSGAVARCLEKLHKDRIASVAPELAFLFHAARDFDRCATYFHKAARDARGVFAFEEAILLARRGLAALESLEKTPERIRTEVLLRVELGASLTAIKGFGDDEVKECFTLAYEKRHEISSRPELGAVLVGLFDFHIARLDIPRARSSAEQLIELGREIQNPGLMFRGQEALGSSFFFNGEFAEAVVALEQMQKESGAAASRADFHFYTVEWEVARLTIIGRCKAIMGFPDEGFRKVLAAVELADSLSHVNSQSWSYFYAAALSQMNPDIAVPRRYVEALLSHATEHGLRFWKAHAAGLKGWLVCREGNLDDGITMLRMGFEAVSAAGSRPSVPYFAGLLATALGRQGRPSEGLAILETAMIEPARLALAELYRIKGELIAQCESTNDAAPWFERAVSVARQQNAKLYELRALTSWMRTLSHSGERQHILQQLTELFHSFTEGFATSDLLAAEQAIALNRLDTQGQHF